jgi:hypothetical protein
VGGTETYTATSTGALTIGSVHVPGPRQRKHLPRTERHKRGDARGQQHCPRRQRDIRVGPGHSRHTVLSSNSLTGIYNATDLSDAIVQGSTFQIINSDPTKVVRITLAMSVLSDPGAYFVCAAEARRLSGAMRID